jgi:hypothetical protein
MLLMEERGGIRRSFMICLGSLGRGWCILFFFGFSLIGLGLLLDGWVNADEACRTMFSTLGKADVSVVCILHCFALGI